MPQTTLYRKTGEEAGTVDLPDELFAAPVNVAVLHQAVVAQLAGRRAAKSPAGGRSRTARRGPAGLARARGAHPITRVAGWSSGRIRGATRSGCRGR